MTATQDNDSCILNILEIIKTSKVQHMTGVNIVCFRGHTDDTRLLYESESSSDIHFFFKSNCTYTEEMDIPACIDIKIIMLTFL
jgi:hypothetical protein